MTSFQLCRRGTSITHFTGGWWWGANSKWNRTLFSRSLCWFFLPNSKYNIFYNLKIVYWELSKGNYHHPAYFIPYLQPAEKDSKRKLQTNISCEYKCKNVKILANWIQCLYVYICIYTSWPSGFVPGVQFCFNFQKSIIY